MTNDIRRKPIVLVVIEHYLPGYRAGGPTRTIINMIKWLSEDFDFKVLTKDHDLGDDSPYKGIEYGRWYEVEGAQVRYLSKTQTGLMQLRTIINGIDFDLCYLDSVFPTTILKILFMYRFGLLQRRPRILATRGQLNPGAMSLKTKKKKLFLLLAGWLGLYRNLFWHASNQTEKDGIEREIKNVEPNSIYMIADLPDPKLLKLPAPQVSKLSNQLRIVFVSRISRMKNLDYALECLTEFEGDIEFDIYGPMEDEKYWHSCLDIMATLPANIQVQYKGAVDHDQVLGIFAQYHLFFLPTRGENFGHVILEALCAGCPVLISDQTAWHEIEDFQVGWAHSLAEKEQFRQTLQHLLEMDHNSWVAYATRAQSFGRTYIRDQNQNTQMTDLFLKVLEQ